MTEVYRAEHIGSFLWPRGVKEGRVAFHEGRISREQLAEAEDKAILEAYVLECLRRPAAALEGPGSGSTRRLEFHP